MDMKDIYLRLQIVVLTIVILSPIVYFLLDSINDMIDERVEQHIQDLPSRLLFQFPVKNQSDGPALAAPQCPPGWTEMGVFRISHDGASNGQGGQVRVCMNVAPKDK